MTLSPWPVPRVARIRPGRDIRCQAAPFQCMISGWKLSNPAGAMPPAAQASVAETAATLFSWTESPGTEMMSRTCQPVTPAARTGTAAPERASTLAADPSRAARNS